MPTYARRLRGHRLRWVLVAASLMLATTAFTAGAGAAPNDPFAGAWFAVDPGDGSDVRIQISGDANGVRHVVLTDNRTGAACGGGPARSIGVGTVSGSTLTTSGTIICPEFRITFENGKFFVSDGLLYDEFGTAFHRQGA